MKLWLRMSCRCSAAWPWAPRIAQYHRAFLSTAHDTQSAPAATSSQPEWTTPNLYPDFLPPKSSSPNLPPEPSPQDTEPESSPDKTEPISSSVSPLSQVEEPVSSPAKRSSRHAWIRKRRRGEPLNAFRPDQITPSTEAVTSKDKAQLLCTYNWHNAPYGNIVLPAKTQGSAPLFKEVPLPVAVPPDRGIYFIDQNSARAFMPLEPLFRAAAESDPSFRFNDVDVVTDRNSLVQLFRFCTGSGKSFALKLLMVHNSLLIERWERRTRQHCSDELSRSYGHNFERLVTKWPRAGLSYTSGHHRVLLYPMGALRCAVRFEVDARYEPPDEEAAAAAAAAAVAADATTKSKAPPIDVPKRLWRPRLIWGRKHCEQEIMVSKERRWRRGEEGEFANPKLAMPMPQSTAAEIKTTTRPAGHISSYLMQLWFGRTPWLIVARHEHGTFVDMRTHHVTEERLAGWEERHEENLRRLTATLEALRDGVRSNGGRACVAVVGGNGREEEKDGRKLNVFAAPTDWPALPNDVVNQLWTS